MSKNSIHGHEKQGPVLSSESSTLVMKAKPFPVRFQFLSLRTYSVSQGHWMFIVSVTFEWVINV